MKNKEIEEILEGIKVVIKHNGTLEFDVKELKILLSHIEQLQNNRDKAIKYINEMSGYDVEDYIRQDLLLLLKGDSE
jgi:hypothetical protein